MGGSSFTTLSLLDFPAWCSQGPTWMVRPMGGIQPQRPSGFSTNNHPTGLGDITGHLLVWPPRDSQPQR